jgi:glyoxylase-like metal-dependent hydrolase (beta-lactamase superfamily II)
MHPGMTSIYLVGHGQALSIDTGDDNDRYRWMLKGYLAALEHVEIGLAALTHHHIDHSANLRWLQSETGCEVAVPHLSQDLLGKRLPETGVRSLRDGESIEAGNGISLEVISTPGHSLDSVCFYLESEGVLFTGDTILGGASTTIDDLSHYLDSLKRLRDLPNLRLICPGHGPAITEPTTYIDSYIGHRLARERQIVDALSRGEALTAAQIVEQLYPEIDARLKFAAEGNVVTHLRKLERDGRVQEHADSTGGRFSMI